MPVATFDRARQLRGLDTIDVHIELAHPDGASDPLRFTARVFADDDGFEGGLKSDTRLLSISAPTRALSDKRGQLRGTTIDITISDHDNLVRGWMDEPDLQVAELELTVWFTTEAQRHLEYDSVPAFRGQVRRITFAAPRLVTFSCEDPFTAAFGQPVPFYAIRADEFPLAPPDALGRVISPVYGVASDEGDTAEPPVLILEPDRGGQLVEGVMVAGYGDLPGATPTNVTLTRNAGAGSINTALPGQKVYAFVTAIHAGVESNPEPFLGTALSADVLADDDAFTLSWTAATGSPSGYRAYIAYFDGELRWNHYIATAGTSVQFTALGTDPDTITPGGTLVTWSVRRTWAIAAIMSGGETALSQEIIGHSTPYRRPLRVTYGNVTSNLGYAAYSKIGAVPGAWQRRETVATDDVIYEDDFDDDPSDLITRAPGSQGVVPGVYAGPYEALDGSIWEIFLLSQGTCKTVHGVFLGGVRVVASRFGVDVLAPGQTGFSTLVSADPWLEIDDLVVTPVLLRGAAATDAIAGTAPLTANVDGLDTDGDTTGTLIEHPVDILEDLLANYILATTPNWAGPRGAMPTFEGGDAKVDAASFAQAKADLSALVSALACAGLWRDPVTAQDLVAELLFNAGAGVCDGGWAPNGAFALSVWSPARVGTLTLTERIDFIRDGFVFNDDIDSLENVFPWGCAIDYQTGEPLITDLDETATASIARYGRRQLPDAPLVFRLHRLPAAVEQLITLRKWRFQWPLRTAIGRVPGFYALVDLGTTVYVDHSEGTGVLGWTARATRAIAATPALDGFETILALEDYRLAGNRVEEDVMHLGGSRETLSLGHRADGTYELREYNVWHIDWPNVPPGVAKVVRLYGQAESGVTCTPHIRNVTDSTSPVVGSAFGTTIAEQTLTIPRPSDNLAKDYIVRVILSGATTKDVFAQANGFTEVIT